MIIRNEKINDKDAVYAVNVSAFETSEEANLVDELRENANSILSLVAIIDEEVVGHIMFSPVILTDYPEIKIMGLAPMAVLPKYQRKEIGSALVQQGLKQCQQLGFTAVVVLGHPKYYPRFGFVPSVKFGFVSEYEIPDEVFMALELQPGALSGKTGVIKYNSAFGSL